MNEYLNDMIKKKLADCHGCGFGKMLKAIAESNFAPLHKLNVKELTKMQSLIENTGPIEPYTYQPDRSLPAGFDVNDLAETALYNHLN